MDELGENPRVKSVEIICDYCGHRMRTSVWVKLIENRMKCRACGKWTVCAKENMVVIYTDGQEAVEGFVGSGTGEGKAFDHLNDDKDISGRMRHIMMELDLQDVETFARVIEAKPDSILRTLDRNEMPMPDTMFNIAEKLGVGFPYVMQYFAQGLHYPGYRVLPGE